ncbi:MAG: DUF4395 domain-containing protein [Lapillicoccus sp.]
MALISSRLVGFPNPVNEKAARVVAGLVVVTAATALVLQTGWLLWLLALGFLLRVLSGPRFSPFGLLATTVVAPRLGRPTLVPGPPKRFAQGLGLAVSLSAAVWVTAGATTVGWTLVGLLIAAAVLESVFAFCLGCVIFGFLQRAGWVPESVCEACADLGSASRRDAYPVTQR